ncbi:MAG: transketolase family protein [Thermodesulfobacteriota bacterium]
MKEDRQELIGTRDVYGQTLVELGEIEDNIVVLDADLSSSTKTSLFARRFSERFFNMGISEQDMMGTAAGLAASGKVPFVSTFAIFATGRAWEQIRQSIAYPEFNVKVVASHGGITVGEDGASHQCIEDIGLMRIIPNMTVIIPADGIETREMVGTIAKYNGPVYMRVSRIKFPVIFKDGYRFEIGRGTVVREGKDVTIIAVGLMVSQALRAARLLESEGIDAKVINMSTVKPIDKELIITSAQETKAIVTAEEHSIIGGLGSAVAEVLVENMPVPMRRVGIKDRFGTSGKAAELIDHFSLSAEDIVGAVKEVLDK